VISKNNRVPERRRDGDYASIPQYGSGGNDEDSK